MKKQQKTTAAVSFDFSFKPVKTPCKTIQLEAPLKDFQVVNFINENVSICKIYIDKDDALKPFLKFLSPANRYDVYSLDNAEPFASILVFEKNNVLNYTVKTTILNVVNKKIEKQQTSNLI